MKRAHFSVSAVLALALMLAGCKQAQTRFFTEGSCPECKALIEAALHDAPGVVSAAWDPASSLVTVSYRPGRSSEDALQQALAQAGFSTGYYEPDSAARSRLPECCRTPITRRLERPGEAGHP
jgi:copper chaperone CopZ